MPFPLSLSQADYETLIAFARQGTLNSEGQVVTEKALGLDSFLRNLEQRNSIVRHSIWVQWQEADAPLPPGTLFPENWPPSLRYNLVLVTRPIARGDVDTLLKAKAQKPVNVLVTRDPAATVGWTELDVFFK